MQRILGLYLLKNNRLALAWNVQIYGQDERKGGRKDERKNLHKEDGLHGSRLWAGFVCDLWVTSGILSWGRHGTEHSRNAAWHTGDLGDPGADDRGWINADRGDGLRDYLHNSECDSRMADRGCGGYRNGREERIKTGRTEEPQINVIKKRKKEEER